MDTRVFDHDYVRRLREGDPATQCHFVTYFGRLIHLKLRNRVRRTQEVEDIRQETFARVLAAIGKPDGIQAPDRLPAFVCGVAENVYREYVRGDTREETTDVLPDSPDSRSDVDAALIDRDRKSLVRRLLEALPKKDRLVLRMVFYEELDRSEVCRRMGIRPDQLRVVVHRARVKLQEKLTGRS